MFNLVGKISESISQKMTSQTPPKTNIEPVNPSSRRPISPVISPTIGRAFSPPDHQFMNTISFIPEARQGSCVDDEFVDPPIRSTQEWNDATSALEALSGIRLNRVPERVSAPGFPSDTSLTGLISEVLGVTGDLLPVSQKQSSNTEGPGGKMLGLNSETRSKSPAEHNAAAKPAPAAKITEESLQDIFVPHESLKTTSVLPKIIVPIGYPDPTFMIESLNSPAYEGQVFDLSFLQIYHPEVITGSGPFIVQTGCTSTHLLASEQLKLSSAGNYYASYPHPPYSARVFKLVHFACAMSANVPIATQDYNDTNEAYRIIINNSILSLTVKMGEIMLKPECRQGSGFLTSSSEAEYIMLVEELKTRWPVLFGVYKMLYNLSHGGYQCISPIPDLCQDNVILSFYIDSIARGTGNILTAPSAMTPRSVSFPRAKIEVALIRPQFEGNSSKSSTPTESMKGKAKESEGGQNIISAEEAVRASRIPRPALKSALIVGSKTSPQMVSSQGGVEEASAHADSLINQGVLGKNVIYRDTTNFREGIQYSTLQNELLQTCISILKDNSVVLKKVNENMERMDERISELDKSLNIVLARGSYTDLSDRQKYNVSLFETAVVAPTERSGAQSPPKSAPLLTISDLVSRVKDFTNEAEDPTLCSDVKQVLTIGGHHSTAAIVVPEAFSRPGFRTRLINRLRQVPGHT